jgi:hypothetical protein
MCASQPSVEKAQCEEGLKGGKGWIFLRDGHEDGKKRERKKKKKSSVIELLMQ